MRRLAGIYTNRYPQQQARKRPPAGVQAQHVSACFSLFLMFLPLLSIHSIGEVFACQKKPP